LGCHLDAALQPAAPPPRIGGSTILYRLYFIMKERQRRLITLKAACGYGDAGEPVITIMLPEED
jgi:hypothetical protein